MKKFAKLGLVSVVIINLTIPSAMAAKKSGPHVIGSDAKYLDRAVEDKEVTAKTASIFTKVFGNSEDDIKTRYEDPEFKLGGKTFVEAINAVKPCKSGCDPEVEKELPAARFFAQKLVELSDASYKKNFPELLKQYAELLEKPTNDSQADEATKRMTVAMGNWDPNGKMTKPWEPGDARMKKFFEAFMQVKGEYETLRKDQDKTLADAAKGSDAAKRKLYGDPDKDPSDKANRLAVGGDIHKKMAAWAEAGNEAKAITMWKALQGKDGTISFKNDKGEMVHYANAPTTTKGILASLKDPLMEKWDFVGHPAEQGQYKEVVWNNGKIEPKPGKTGGVDLGRPGVPAPKPGTDLASAKSDAGSVDLSTVDRCSTCHGKTAGKTKPLAASKDAVAKGRMPPSGGLSEADKAQIAGVLQNAALAGQVAAK